MKTGGNQIVRTADGRAMVCILTFDTVFDHALSRTIRYCGTPIAIHPFRGRGFFRIMRGTFTPREFSPRLPSAPLRRLLGLLAEVRGPGLADSLKAAAAAAAESDVPWKAEEKAILLVLADLAALGWRFRVVKGVVYMLAGTTKGAASAEAAKEMLRGTLLEARSEQLAESGTSSFLASMHQPRQRGDRTVSIDNLLDDGDGLAADLRSHRDSNLDAVVRPYLQFVDSARNCEFTGLNLMDVWRYFRHTWALVYRPTPGRTVNFLIRNAARPDHPVMGIIGLANAVFQLASRDHHIGWTPESLVGRIVDDPSAWLRFRERAVACLEEARSSIRMDDLMEEIGADGDPLRTVQRLETLAHEQGKARKERLRAEYESDPDSSVSARNIPRSADGSPDWMAASEQPLFKRKRADALADILFTLHFLENAGDDALSGRCELVREASGNGRADKLSVRWFDRNLERACKTALREIKKNGVATRILDVNVCGASPAYREILGGKLAAMALFSAEIQDAYRMRYGDAVSEIASAMAGRPITRQTGISLLTTTSLYGVGSSQYNRVKMNWNGAILEWKQIGATEGFGTVHMSRQTVEAVRTFAVGRQGMRNVNNRFGEGTSPLMRQLREGLSMLGFDSDHVLQHSNKRIVYALELHPGACRDLALDMDTAPGKPPMSEVARAWTDRWLSMRVQNERILQNLSGVNAATVRRSLMPGT